MEAIAVIIAAISTLVAAIGVIVANRALKETRKMADE